MILNQGNINNTVYVHQEDVSSSLSSPTSSREDSLEDATSPQSIEGANLQKRKGKRSRNACQKRSILNSRVYLGVQVLIQIAYWVVLLLSLRAHASNFSRIEELNSKGNLNQYVSVKPSSASSYTELKDNNDLIDAMDTLELVLLFLLVADLFLKQINHLSILSVKRKTTTQAVDHHEMELQDNVDYLFNSGFIQLKGEPVISNSVVVMDLLLLLVLTLVYLIQHVFISSAELTYIQVGVLLISRFYLRLPFTVALLAHHYKLKLARLQERLLFQNRERNDFTTYKEKVLFIINQVRLQLGRVLYMCHPNHDLAWCAYVIENDFLQISNSISDSHNLNSTQAPNSSKSNGVYEPEEVSKRSMKLKGSKRRFSKTISYSFGQRNQNTVDSLKMKKI